MKYLSSVAAVKEHQKAYGGGPCVSKTQKIFNFVGCLVASSIYFYFYLYSAIPLVLDGFLAVVLAEYCRYSNDRRRSLTLQEFDSYNLSLLEKSRLGEKNLDCIAAVVGFREDPDIFEQALQSYARARNCKFLLVSIDGDQKEDQQMVEIFKQVHPDRSALLHFDTPLVEIALQMDRERRASTSDKDIIDRCCSIVRRALEGRKIRFTGENAVTSLCVSQPHLHKKGIMFTSFIVSLVISDTLGMDYLWTSDSDSMVMVDTLRCTIASFASDQDIGGASTPLSVHNKDETIITQLGNAIYLHEMYIQRCFTASMAANDCQSGPCAAFRIMAISGELLAWYKQNIFGHWMVVNEDRHLTTRLLLKGWKVIFVCDALTATESPRTLRRWLLQQVRWARATHIETFHRPSVYLMHSPILFFGALRREVASFILPGSMVSYLYLGSVATSSLSFGDYFGRRALIMAYLALRNPYRPSFREWLWGIPANAFFNILQPAIQFWGLLTVFSDSWGTTMRSRKEISRYSNLQSKIWECGFFVLWIGIVGGILGRYFATTLFPEIFNVGMCVMSCVVLTWLISGYWMILVD